MTTTTTIQEEQEEEKPKAPTIVYVKLKSGHAPAGHFTFKISLGGTELSKLMCGKGAYLSASSDFVFLSPNAAIKMILDDQNDETDLTCNKCAAVFFSLLPTLWALEADKNTELKEEMKKRKTQRYKEKLSRYYDTNDEVNIDNGLMSK